MTDALPQPPAPDWQPAPDGEYKCGCGNPDCTARLILYEGDLNIEDEDGFLMSIVLPDNLRVMISKTTEEGNDDTSGIEQEPT